MEAISPQRSEWSAAQGTPQASSGTSTGAAAPAATSASAAASPTGTATGAAPVRRIVAPPSAAATNVLDAELSGAFDRDILIVVSKLKKYIRDRSGMNTSDAVADALSERVRALCDAAIRNAGRDGRKTVLDRDVPLSAP